MSKLGGDSTEYELLDKCCALIMSDKPFTCEIGVRLGLGSKIILDSLKHLEHWHIGIDPYGDIKYDHFDKDSTIKHNDGGSPTYPNSMKQTVLQNLEYSNYTLFQMSDEDFMHRFYDGVPIYHKKRILRNDYDLVMLDGPHKTIDVLKELLFFGERLNDKGFIILDDYQSYKFDLLIKVAQLIDVKPMHVGDNKIILRKYES